MTSEYFAQTPSLSLDEIAQILWQRNEHPAYRALLAFIKEREAMHAHLRELEHERKFVRA